MVIVPDASIVVPLLMDPTTHRDMASRISKDRAVAPHVLDVEVSSAMRRRVRLDDVPPIRAREAIADLFRLPVERWPHRPLLDGMWQVRENISAYDASYVSLAMLMGATLYTCDARLARAAERWCDVELLSVAH